MNVDILKIFVTVVEQKHFSRAAELLNLSQPGVSMHIRNLENEFGTTLIQRSPKHVQVTEAGNILYIHAKQMLSLYEEAKQEINELHNVVTGTLRIGASFTIGEYLLPKILANYANENPHVEVHTFISNTEDVLQSLRSNQIDIGLVEGQVIYADVDVETFMQDEMKLVVPPNHPLLRTNEINESTLQDQVWVLRESGSGTRAYSDRFIHQHHLKMKRFFTFSSIQSVKEAVSAGLGIAILSDWTVRKELLAKELFHVEVPNEQLIRPFSIVRGKYFIPSKAIQVFLNHVNSFAKKQH
ncbi:LysR family transcriptional regulator [Bacillus sp. S70]|uniref:LysR family transcriptional regulator n=1 Tax=unclassified Bacillus (in: firmicutes) TaxID=185979 RepID=UPI0019099FD3|nr:MULTISPECIES: LysR substrate-binding domain-containing protein [unclassified Bacillus (in: firmicutes)]MBJ9981579.1 LysR family transcriptional regulator [Bacillus sp. S29]MBK0101994.1 LysR family transcriptional regulator [Bacillus sp. S70]MBK0107348.1 LysR family transcriptional regulator [Bacillus sp. S73]MBK0136258.1 LysR family transcriptional regulator [Bacillus sp. S72]MBK0146653.1 LysR family transcriptional regulator [Bacillus sp. S74]